MTTGRRRRLEKESGVTRRIDSLLTGEGDIPVAVAVELVDSRDDVIAHNLQKKSDFDVMDFFWPLILMVIIAVLEFMNGWAFIGMFFNPMLVIYVFMGYGIIFLLRLYLLWDLLKRVRRRPSGKRMTGFVPPFKSSNWGFAFAMYALSIPVIIALHKLNILAVGELFPSLVATGLPEIEEANSIGMFSVTDGISGWVMAIFLVQFFQVVIFAPFCEELWFRGVGLAGFMKSGSRIRAVLWTSGIFGILHGITRFFDSGFFGILACFIRFRTGSIYCTMAVHALHNFIALMMAYSFLFS